MQSVEPTMLGENALSAFQRHCIIFTRFESSLTMRQDKPIVGLTTYGRSHNGRFYLHAEYLDAVRRAGGMPLLLCPGETELDRLLQLVDALIFSGGGDLDASAYDGADHPTMSGVDVERDRFELALAEKAMLLEKPILGICRGSQLLHVASGGELWQHIPEKYGNSISHTTADGEATEHMVHLMPESWLRGIIPHREIKVVSKHHQGIRDAAPGWQVTARAEDGVVEAIEHTGRAWLKAVLWHPEMAENDAAQQTLLRDFIQACNPKNP